MDSVLTIKMEEMIRWSPVCSLVVHLVLSSQKIVFQTTCSLQTCWTLNT